MEIKETATSLKTQVIQMIKKGFPNLSVDEDSWNITIHRKSFFELFTDGKGGELKIRINSTDSLLFNNGEWTDVNMVVYDAKFLTTAIQIGQKFERLSGKSATIIKEF